jgi:hypothetical protein
MRKALVTIGLTVGVLAAVQPILSSPSFAVGVAEWAVCRTLNIKCNKDTHGAMICANTYINCVHQTVQNGSGASGPGPAPDVPARRNIRPN